MGREAPATDETTEVTTGQINQIPDWVEIVGGVAASLIFLGAAYYAIRYKVWQWF